MTNHQKRVLSLWIDRCFRALVIIGLAVALFAVVRDIQTRGLVDKTAREKTRVLCVAVNSRWEAYFDEVTKIAAKRRPGESDEAYAVRKAQTVRLVDKIRAATHVNCDQGDVR